MKKLLFFLYSTLCIAWATPSHSTFAQVDSVRITHTQETGTLEKQRFIDKYDYVFMTKEPTKWMLKATLEPLYSSFLNTYYVPSVQTISPWWLSFERKITPSFSLQVGATYFERASKLVKVNQTNVSQLPYFDFNDRRRNTTLGDKWIFLGFVESRWYYNLAKRIKEGKSENNFSANYIGIRLDKAFNPTLEKNSGELTSTAGKYDTDYQLEQLKHRITLAYGLQRRFLKHGVVDFGLQLSQNSFQQVGNQVTFLNGDNSVFDPQNPQPNFASNIQNNWSDLGVRKEWELKTGFRLGIAIGDFKRNNKAPLCDVWRCYETKRSLWKFTWPQLTVNPSSQSIRSGIGYEYRLGNTPFSINSQVDFQFTHGLYHNVNYEIDQAPKTADLDLSTTYILATLQPRFYFTQTRRIQKGFERNLSGWYLGVSWSGIAESSRRKFSNNDIQEFRLNRGGFKPVIGFQQQLFRNGYVDASLSPLWLGKGNNPVSNIFGADIKLGFAF